MKLYMLLEVVRLFTLGGGGVWMTTPGRGTKDVSRVLVTRAC